MGSFSLDSIGPIGYHVIIQDDIYDYRYRNHAIYQKS
jgi:hypothetical protein